MTKKFDSPKLKTASFQTQQEFPHRLLSLYLSSFVESLKNQAKASIKNERTAVFTLLNSLPEEEDEIAYHLAVYIVAKYLPTLSVGKPAVV